MDNLQVIPTQFDSLKSHLWSTHWAVGIGLDLGVTRGLGPRGPFGTHCSRREDQDTVSGPWSPEAEGQRKLLGRFHLL